MTSKEQETKRQGDRLLAQVGHLSLFLLRVFTLGDKCSLLCLSLSASVLFKGDHYWWSDTAGTHTHAQHPRAKSPPTHLKIARDFLSGGRVSLPESFYFAVSTGKGALWEWFAQCTVLLTGCWKSIAPCTYCPLSLRLAVWELASFHSFSSCSDPEWRSPPCPRPPPFVLLLPPRHLLPGLLNHGFVWKAPFQNKD